MQSKPDIWLQNRGKRYEYIIVYVDLAISMEDPKSFIDEFTNQV